jgi:hypothetical protein
MIAVCTGSHWPDMLVYALAKLMDDPGVDGVYMDGAVGYQCSNAAHGHGWRDDNGVWRTQYTIFALRNFYRRLATAFEDRKPDYILWAHMSGSMAIPALSFATMTWDGEQFSRQNGPVDPTGDYTKMISLDMARAEFMGRQWGLIPHVLVYGRSQESTDSMLATFLPLGLADNLWWGWVNEARLRQVWAIQDAFGCEQAEFVPYWESAKEVATAPASPTLVTSVWKRDGKQLLVVCNLGAQPEPATLTPRMTIKSVTDTETRAPVALQDGRFQMVVPAKSWKMIVLE